jgi:hypothetical protein
VADDPLAPSVAPTPTASAPVAPPAPETETETETESPGPPPNPTPRHLVPNFRGGVLRRCAITILVHQGSQFVLDLALGNGIQRARYTSSSKSSCLMERSEKALTNAVVRFFQVSK